MKRIIALVLCGVMTGLGLAATGCSESAMDKRAAKPAMGERLSNEAVKGRVTRAEGDYLWIKEDGGKEVRVHVDDRTKMDRVVQGDAVKAYITENGHATTVQRQ